MSKPTFKEWLRKPKRGFVVGNKRIWPFTPEYHFRYSRGNSHITVVTSSIDAQTYRVKVSELLRHMRHAVLKNDKRMRLQPIEF